MGDNRSSGQGSGSGQGGGSGQGRGSSSGQGGGSSERGFAAMDDDEQREIASKGGSMSPGNFKNDPERAAEAGREGGKASAETRNQGGGGQGGGGQGGGGQGGGGQGGGGNR